MVLLSSPTSIALCCMFAYFFAMLCWFWCMGSSINNLICGWVEWKERMGCWSIFFHLTHATLSFAGFNMMKWYFLASENWVILNHCTLQNWQINKQTWSASSASFQSYHRFIPLFSFNVVSRLSVKNEKPSCDDDDVFSLSCTLKSTRKIES